MKRAYQILVLISVVLFVGCLNTSTSAEVKLVTPEEMQTILELEDVQLVDVRTPSEFNEEHIENAQNIDFTSPTFEEDILKLDKNRPVVLYCKSGGRSAKCVKKLEEAGFKKIYDLDGGISKWKYNKDTEGQGTP